MLNVVYAWGRDDTSYTRRTFKSQEARDAYLAGIRDCEGWEYLEELSGDEITEAIEAQIKDLTEDD